MLIRAIALAVALLIGVGTLIPMMTDYSEAGPKNSRKYKKKRTWKVKKYSKKWWALYRHQQQRRKAMIARRRAIRARQILLARKMREETAPLNAKYASAAPVEKIINANAAREDASTVAPQTWKKAQANTSELQYNVSDDKGLPMGTASLTVVGTAMESAAGSREKNVGGVSTNALRRTVIDKMMREDGWVVNDYQKELNGRKVYVVVAQSPAGGATRSRLFYFTEVNGRIYSLATSAPSSEQERLAQESEKVINSLQRTNRSVQAELR